MILVTGGAGYIGSALVKKLIEEKKEVIVVDDLSQGEKKYIHPKARFYQVDITQKYKMDEIFQKHKIEIVFHLSAKKAVGESEEKPFLYINNNLVGTINLLEVMEKHQCRKIIFSSTACVYKENNKGIYQEKDFVETYNLYGFTKLQNENAIRELARLGKIEYIIFRYFNVCGDAGLLYQEKKAKNIFPVLSQSIQTKRKFKIFGDNYPTKDGSGVRDYIHLTDLISAHIKAMKAKKNQTYNLGTNQGTSVFEIIKEFEKQLGRKIQYQVSPRRKGDVALCLADYKKAERELGWIKTKNLASMVKDFIQVYHLK